MTADAKATRHDWTVPGVYPVAPGVHRVPLPLPTDGLRAVNVYVVEDDGGLVLIDSGWALEQARTALTSALGALGAGLAARRHRRLGGTRPVAHAAPGDRRARPHPDRDRHAGAYPGAHGVPGAGSTGRKNNGYR